MRLFSYMRLIYHIFFLLSRKIFTPAAESLGFCPWMNAPAFGRDVAPLEGEVECHGLCPWGSTFFENGISDPKWPWWGGMSQ